MLLHLGGEEDNLRSHIAHLSHLWWTKGLPNRQNMAAILLTYLLDSTLQAKVKVSIYPLKVKVIFR